MSIWCVVLEKLLGSSLTPVSAGEERSCDSDVFTQKISNLKDLNPMNISLTADCPSKASPQHLACV